MAVQITGSKAKLTPEKIDAAEKALGVELPEPYRRFLLAHNGGRPEPADFKIRWRGQPFAPAMMVQDLASVERDLGFQYELADGGHYQQVCPKCRRALFGLAQGALWRTR